MKIHKSRFVLILLSIVLLVPALSDAMIIESQISSGKDDAEELLSSGLMKLSSSDLELTQEQSQQKVGMRFSDITIPKGAQITNAYIQFQVDEADDVETSLVIEGQAHDNAPTFSETDGDISSRTDRTSAVQWSNIPEWMAVGEAGLDQQTSDIKMIIQEIVNRTGWQSGNSIVIIITGTGKRVAESFDGTGTAPVLHVEYTTVPPEICDDGTDNDGDNLIDCADPDCSGDPVCTPGQPKITEVHVDLAGNSIHIEGDNIDENLMVTLGDYIDPLDCVSNASINCTLPQGITHGDYLLTVETGDGKRDEYDLTIGSELTDALCDLYSATGNPLPEVCPVKLVFVTSERGNGDLSTWTSAGLASGLAAADNVCNALATNAVLPGTYKAWLSTSIVDAKDRIPDARYVNTNGDIVADNKADLLDGSLDNAIGYNQLSAMLVDIVWTGTHPSGSKTVNTCNDWTSAIITVKGNRGDSGASGGQWTSVDSGLCQFTRRLYCFQE